MKFRALVALTALSLFFLFFFLGLSSGSGMTIPSQNSVMYKLFKVTALVTQSSREALLTIALQVQKALNLSIIEVEKTTKVIKDTVKKVEKKKPTSFKPPPNTEKAIEASLEANKDQVQLPAQDNIANSEITNNEIIVLLYNSKNISQQPIFEEQMQFLAVNKYTTITVPEMEIKRSGENKAKLVVLTFDLSFKDFYDKVFPVLQKHNLKATIFAHESYRPEAAEELVIDAFLRKGSSGTKTRELQQKLNNFGYRLRSDGLFGTYTMAKVVDFQRTNFLLVDGIVGPQTTGQINKLVSELKAIQKSELVVIMNQKPKLANEQYIPENYSLNDFSTLLQASKVKEKNISK